MKTITCRIENQLWKDLHRIAKENGMIFSAFLWQILENVVDEDKELEEE